MKERKPRIIKGGSRLYSAEYCRAAYRFGLHPDSRVLNRGFRLVLRSIKKCSNNRPLVVRGGSWSLGHDFSRCTARNRTYLRDRINFEGFRCVLMKTDQEWESHATKGGSRLSSAERCRTAKRNSARSDFRYHSLGFRLTTVTAEKETE